MRVSSYRRKINFPAGSDNGPNWNLGDAVGGAVESAQGSSDSAIPAYLVTVQVDTRTLAVTSSKA
jgi:hypothetical protein